MPVFRRAGAGAHATLPRTSSKKRISCGTSLRLREKKEMLRLLLLLVINVDSERCWFVSKKKLIGARDFFPAHNNNETQNTFAKRSFVFTVHFFKHTTALSRRSSESECVCGSDFIYVSVLCVFYALLHFCCFVFDGNRDRLVFLVFLLFFCLVDGILSRFILFSLNFVAF